MRSINTSLVACFFAVAIIVSQPAASQAKGNQEEPVVSDYNRIQMYEKNPRYWQYRGKPVLLLGGSDDDNLFQWTGSRLTEQLDLLNSVGGNYVRCTMSSRDEGNVWPFAKGNGTYDLDQWNEEYWRRFENFLESKAKRTGTVVQTTEMWYDHLDNNPPIPHATFDHPETYSFVDVSQNSHKRGQQHWNSLRLQLSRVDDRVRPLTNVKIYGADTGPERWFRADVDGVERLWRNIFGGMASARFHRPPAGLGLGKKAQANIYSLRMLTDNMDIFMSTARNDLLSGREPNEAYCLANPGKEYAVYFPDGGEVKLDINPLKKLGTIRWLEISTCKWEKRQELKAVQNVTLRPPSSGPWAVLLTGHCK